MPIAKASLSDLGGSALHCGWILNKHSQGFGSPRSPSSAAFVLFAGWGQAVPSPPAEKPWLPSQQGLVTSTEAAAFFFFFGGNKILPSRNLGGEKREFSWQVLKWMGCSVIGTELGLKPDMILFWKHCSEGWEMWTEDKSLQKCSWSLPVRDKAVLTALSHPLNGKGLCENPEEVWATGKLMSYSSVNLPTEKANFALGRGCHLITSHPLTVGRERHKSWFFNLSMLWWDSTVIRVYKCIFSKCLLKILLKA